MATDIEHTLNDKLRDDLNIIARKLQIRAYRSLNKSDVIAAILNCDESRVRQCLSISWWDRYHNHVYGGVTIVACVLSIIFFVLPRLATTEPLPKAEANVKLGISEPDIHDTVVNNFVMVRNEGTNTVTGIEIELNTLPSDTFGFLKGKAITQITMEPPVDDAGMEKPINTTVIAIRRLVPEDYVTVWFQSQRNEWDGIVPQLQSIDEIARFPNLISANHDSGWVQIDHSIITLHGFGDSIGTEGPREGGATPRSNQTDRLDEG